MDNELYVNHLHGYNGVTEKIKRAMYEAAKDFVYIGFLLREVQNNKFYEEGGYKSVYDYAEAELHFKRSSTKNFIAIAKTFGVQQIDKYHLRQTMCLQPAYEEFNYSQLTEMLSMSAVQREKATPEMTIRELRDLKKEPAAQPDPKIDFATLDKLIDNSMSNAGGQTSGQENNEEIYILVNNYWSKLSKKEIRDLCFLTGTRFNTKSTYDISIKPIPKSLDRHITKRKLCEACGIRFDPANYDYEITMQIHKDS